LGTPKSSVCDVDDLIGDGGLPFIGGAKRAGIGGQRWRRPAQPKAALRSCQMRQRKLYARLAMPILIVARGTTDRQDEQTHPRFLLGKRMLDLSTHYRAGPVGVSMCRRTFGPHR